MQLSQAIGGSVWHGIKGFRNSPYGERRIGALTAIKARAPVLGGNFGVWGGLFSTFDCAVKGIRKKEDPYNASTSIPPLEQLSCICASCSMLEPQANTPQSSQVSSPVAPSPSAEALRLQETPLSAVPACWLLSRVSELVSNV